MDRVYGHISPRSVVPDLRLVPFLCVSKLAFPFNAFCVFCLIRSCFLSFFVCFFLSFSALSAAYFKSLISAVESKYIFMAGWLDGEGDGYGGRRRVLALGLGSGLVGRKGWEA